MDTVFLINRIEFNRGNTLHWIIVACGSLDRAFKELDRAIRNEEFNTLKSMIARHARDIPSEIGRHGLTRTLTQDGKMQVLSEYEQVTTSGDWAGNPFFGKPGSYVWQLDENHWINIRIDEQGVLP